MANITTNFSPSGPHWIMKQLPIEASQAMEMGSFVNSKQDGTYELTNLAANNNLKGILAETIATTDSDYATSGKAKGVMVPRTVNAEMFFTVGAGTFTAADVGKAVAVHTDGKSLAVDTAGNQFLITKYISATRGICKFSQLIEVAA